MNEQNKLDLLDHLSNFDINFLKNLYQIKMLVILIILIKF